MVQNDSPILNSPIIGYAHHQIILNDKGEACDFRFLEINDSYEKITGLKKKYLIGHTFREALPEFVTNDFDWISFYAKTAIEGLEQTKEQYSKTLDKWFKVHVYSTEKLFFSILLIDITESKKKTEELENFFSVNLDLLCIADLEGNFLKLNQSWTDILGYTTKDLTGRRFLDFIHPDDIQSTVEAIEKLSSGSKVLNFTNRYLCKDGSYRWIEWRSYPKDKLIYAAARDITEKINQEKKLIESQNQYQSLVNNLPGITYRCKNDDSLKLVFISSNISDIYGYTPEEIINGNDKSLTSLIIEEDKKKYFFTVKKAIKQNKSWEIEYRLKHKNGSILWVYEKGKAISNKSQNTSYIDGFIQDISGLKKTEEELKFQNTLLKIQQEVSLDGILIVDENDNIISFNKHFAEIWGIPESILSIQSGEKALEYVLPKLLNPDDFTERIHYLYKNRDEKSFDIVKLINGKILERFSAPVIGSHQEYYGRIWYYRDITDRKKAEQALEKAKNDFQAITNLTGDIIVQLDKNGNWIFLNNQACNFWGKSREELLGSDFSEYLHPDDIPETSKTILKMIESKKPKKGLINRQKTPKGYRYVQWNGAPIFDKNEYIGFQATGRDITEEIQAREMIEESEKRLNTLISNTPAVIYTYTIDSEGRIKLTYINDNVENVLGFSPQDLNNFEFWKNCVHPNDLPQLKEKLKGKNITNQYRFKDKNDDYHWLLDTQKILKNENDTIEIIGSWWDITEQKKAQIALNYERDLFTSGPVFTIEWEPSEDWPIRTVSSNVKEILGYTKEEMTKKDFIYSSIIHPEDLEKVYREVKHNIEKHIDIYEQSYRLKTKSGNYRWFYDFTKLVRDEEGELIAIRGYMYDNTKQKVAESELLKERLRLSNIIRGTNVGTWEWNIETGETKFNEKWAEIIGYTLDEISPVSIETWMKFAHPDDLKLSEKKLEKHFKGESDYYESESRMKHKNGHWVWVLDRGKVAIWTQDKKPLMMLGTHQDITEKKLQENNLIKAKEAAEAASKAKSEFLANMSHEIRTPLNGVIGFTHLLKNTPLNDTQKQYVESANVSAHSLLSIINDVLDLSKIESGKLELDPVKTNIVELVEEASDIIKYHSSEKNLELLLNIATITPESAVVDPIRLKQVLVNLLSNAVKFTEKGEVEIKLTFKKINSRKGIFSFFIRDTGIGISKEQQAKLFKSFSQADASTTRKYGGTGLGLVIANSLVEKMGGKIDLESKPGIGSTFYFSIQTDYQYKDKPDITDINSIKTVLIVDDNQNNRKILKHTFNNWNIITTEAENALEAMVSIEKSEPFDLILIDYQMPYVNGLELIKMIREKFDNNKSKQPILLLYSSVDDSFINQELKKNGLNYKLSKPVKTQILYEYLLRIVNNSDPKNLSEEVQLEQEKNDKKENSDFKKDPVILVAEDVKMNMELIKIILNNLLYSPNIIEAFNGKEAIEKVKSQRIDLVLMDIQMPILDGLQATETLRQDGDYKNLPIVVLTAGATKIEKEKCFKAGATDFLVKPINEEKLSDTLKKLGFSVKD